MCYSALVKQDLKQLQGNFGAVVIQERLDEFLRASASNPKRFPPLEPRIFPGHYAQVLSQVDGQILGEPRRYGAYPPPSVKDARVYTTFNARRDNLTSMFWSEAFCQHHGFVVLEGFYEWVAVKDLLEAGVVKLKDVEAEFAKQAAERKAKILKLGKPYRPTPTEKKDPHLRKIIIEFKPEDGRDLVTPVIISYSHSLDGAGNKPDSGFAIVTDDPPGEIRDAGHDRCPVILEVDALTDWLRPEKFSPQHLVELLGRRQRITFRHRLAEAA